MKFNLGQVRKGREVVFVKFKEWVKGDIKELAGRYPITHLLLPRKFPSGAVLFRAGLSSKGELVYIRLTVKAETLKELLKTYGFKKKRDKEGLRLWFIIDENGNYGIEDEEVEGDEIVKYEWNGNGWKLIEVLGKEEEEEEEEGIEF